MQGWIKLHRKLLENPIMKKPELLQLFVFCLLKANHEDGKAFWGMNEMEVKRGQFITGRFELAYALNCKPETIYKRLQTLRKMNIVNTESNNKNTLVTIVNYELYQAEEEKSNNKSNNEVTTNEQQSNTNKNDKNVRNKELNILSKDNIVSLPSDKVPYSDILNLFNTICNTLPKIQDIKETRQKTIRVIWKDVDSIDYFKTLFEKVNESDFLSGRNGKWMNCCFDWIIKPANRKKILEGTYINKDATAYW